MLFFLISHETIVNTKLRILEIFRFILKTIFILDLHHEGLEVDIMGNNSLLFMKLFEESIAKSVKCCMKAVAGRDNISGLNHKVQNRDKLTRIQPLQRVKFVN